MNNIVGEAHWHYFGEPPKMGAHTAKPFASIARTINWESLSAPPVGRIGIK